MSATMACGTAGAGHMRGAVWRGAKCNMDDGAVDFENEFDHMDFSAVDDMDYSAFDDAEYSAVGAEIEFDDTDYSEQEYWDVWREDEHRRQGFH